MSNSGRRAAVYTCVCLCVHILVFAHNLNQYTQEGGIKATCRRQKLQKQTSCTQCSVNSTILSISATNNSFNVCLFLPQDTIPLFSVCLLETINLQLLPVALLSSFQFFFFSSNESFQAWPLCARDGPLRVTKTVDQSRICLSGLGYVSLILNDRRKPEMDFRVAGGNSSHVLTWKHMLK